jgi:EAL domain-containing protein (putative c-di-GMP-specific phosphodiesterase class I)
MDALAQARRAMEADLRCAVSDEAFELFYQPIIDIPTRALLGFEALVRWRHPTRGLITPDHFIPLAEAIGLISPLGRWVLRNACAEAATWPGHLRVAVNLSPLQFAGGTLMEDVTMCLREAALDPRRLELEITETAMLLETDATVSILHQFRGLGIAVAMDDFGTGYSSLSYLHRFPFDRVKIDRSFVANLGITPESAAIIGAVTHMCTSLDMATTGEGVETESQLAALAAIGCREAQGYYFSPPVAAGAVAAIIARLDSGPSARISPSCDG